MCVCLCWLKRCFLYDIFSDIVRLLQIIFSNTCVLGHKQFRQKHQRRSTTHKPRHPDSLQIITDTMLQQTTNNQTTGVTGRQPKTTPITDDFEISNTVLGLGINGKVVQCTNRRTGNLYALKVRHDLDYFRWILYYFIFNSRFYMIIARHDVKWTYTGALVAVDRS